MKQCILLFGALCLFLTSAIAQNNVGVGTTTPNASAALDVQSTTQGMLVPRMTEAQRNLIATPATGLMVYQTDVTAGFYFYNGSAWTSLSGGGSSLPAQTGNAGKALTTDGTTASWDYPTMRTMTKAQRDALTSPALGTTIFQTDDYPGLYTKMSDGWRCMSGEPPMYIHDVGTLTVANTPGTVLTLDASHHTVMVVGSWTGGTSGIGPRVIQLPSATTCKGRVYRIICNNTSTTTSTFYTGGSVTLGYGMRLTDSPNTADYWLTPMTVNPTTGATTPNIPDAKSTTIQSDGSRWLIIGYDTSVNTEW
jgi:hypothetical protein